MHNIKFIREHADVLKEDLKGRGSEKKIAWVDEVLEKDKQYRELLGSVQELRAERNTVSKQINTLRKEGKDASEQMNRAKEIPAQIKEIEETTNQLQNEIRSISMRIPNILHESVPKGNDEEGNVTVREVGDKPTFDFELKNHGELLEEKEQADFKRATNISGAGFYFLKDKGALLDFALQRFAMDILLKKGYTLITPPLFLRREPYEGVTDLADFESVMYKIEEDDLYLIATSEHAIGAMHKGEVLDKLPLKYAGISPCFRREIGSHGLDTKGLFRVHQFNKIEQFIFCKPEDSWQFHEELLQNAEEIFKALELPYRVVNICTGDIGTVAAKKYDIEVWMPREQKYREVVSCSNCTAYQATRLNIKYLKDDQRDYVHTLNSTAIATSRVIRAICENFQQSDGSVLIPKVLHSYMSGHTQL